MKSINLEETVKMLGKIAISIVFAMVLAIPTSTVLASSGQHARPPINPNFDPDESCQLDAYQEKCTPGSEQECPDGFGQNEDATCVPKDDCPEGYHRETDDETGQCYPDDEGCSSDSYVMIEREDGSKYCEVLYLLCDEAEHSSTDYCIEFCEENPDSMGCNRPE